MPIVPETLETVRVFCSVQSKKVRVFDHVRSETVRVLLGTSQKFFFDFKNLFGKPLIRCGLKF